MSKPFDVFLSHNSVDKPWVQKLKGVLEEKGLRVWLDKDEIRPGDLFGEALERGIAESDCVTLVISPESMKSGWVKQEYYRALSLASEDALRLIPAVLRDAEIPGFLRDRNWVDFRDPDRFDASVNALFWGITGNRTPSQTYSNPTSKQESVGFTPGEDTKFAPAFLQKLSDAPVKLVVGAFRQFSGWEPSGLMGLGDANGMVELTTAFARSGMRNHSVSYADRLDGDILQNHVISLGGPDANSISCSIVERLRTSIRFGDPRRNIVSITDTTTEAIYVPKRSEDTILNDFGVIFWTINPFFPTRRCLLVAGSFGYGTWAGVRFVLSKAFCEHPLVLEGSVECLVETQLFRETPLSIRPILMRRLPDERQM